MGLDQKGDIVFQVSCGENSQWDVNEKGCAMTLSRNLILALTVTGGAALAAGLAVRRHARRLKAAQHKTDLQTWESEGGSPVPPAVVKPPF